jgi:HEAT repeat protein
MRALAVIVLMEVVAGGAVAQTPEPPKLPVPDLVKALIDTLKDADGEVRIYSGNALAAIGPPAVEALTTTLSDPNRDARAAAAYALGQMGADAAPATAALVKALKDSEIDVRRQAAQALSRIVLSQRLPTIPIQPLLPLQQPSVPPPVFPSVNP